MIEERKRLVLLYHFFHPDDVISARLYSDIAEEFGKQGWSVLAMPSVRSCHDGAAAYPKRENWNGVEIHRVWRPDWKQSSNRGRVGNTIAMLVGWTWRALWTRRSKHETVIIGTDPPLGVLVAIPWRLFRPRARIIHWCHDLYPHAAIAEGIVQPNSVFVRLLNAILRVAYQRCDAIVDLGPCMREELLKAKKLAARSEKLENEKHLTLTPWALVEPEKVLEADVRVKQDLFGDAKLGLLYSGNLGRAHVYKPFLELARRVSGDSIAFCYAGRGPRMDELRNELHTELSPSPPAPLPGVPGRGETRYPSAPQDPSPKQDSSAPQNFNTQQDSGTQQGSSAQHDSDARHDSGAGHDSSARQGFSTPQAESGGLKIRFAGFASEEELGKRLGAADVHMVSLAPNWTGAVVPSKFFGALAVGRPVLFAGSPQSAIARWIEEFKVGWVLDDDASVDRVAGELRAFAADPNRVQAMRQHCHDVYRREFSKAVQMERWGKTLDARC